MYILLIRKHTMLVIIGQSFSDLINHTPLQMLYWTLNDAINKMVIFDAILYDKRWNTINGENKLQQLEVSTVTAGLKKMWIWVLCAYACVCMFVRVHVCAWGTAWAAVNRCQHKWARDLGEREKHSWANPLIYAWVVLHRRYLHLNWCFRYLIKDKDWALLVGGSLFLIFLLLGRVHRLLTGTRSTSLSPVNNISLEAS